MNWKFMWRKFSEKICLLWEFLVIKICLKKEVFVFYFRIVVYINFLCMKLECKINRLWVLFVIDVIFVLFLILFVVNFFLDFFGLYCCGFVIFGIDYIWFFCFDERDLFCFEICFNWKMGKWVRKLYGVCGFFVLWLLF